MRIERSHPLRRLFTELVERYFFRDVRGQDARVAATFLIFSPTSPTWTTSTGFAWRFSP